MGWKRACATVLAGCLTAAAPAAAEPGAFHIELNDTVELEAGCRLVFVAFNGAGVVVERASYDMFTFDSDGRVAQSLLFQFGGFPVDRTKVVQFDLPDQSCEGISRLLVNDVTECSADGGPSTLCIDALKTTTRTPIVFGL